MIRRLANRFTMGTDICESSLRAVPLVVVDPRLEAVLVGADELLLTSTPHTSNRHEWNKR
ncbi:hypothetical protein ATCCBAA256_34550 [Mycobacterium montefiorense]|nr:hypothetical protein ATCCBAA256_34550 [Mycobacterium montefiorense]